MHEGKIHGDMNSEKKDWEKMRREIKARFDRLPDAAIDDIQGHTEVLSEKLQNIYGYSRVRADREAAAFNMLPPMDEGYNNTLKAQMNRIPYFDTF